MQMHAAKRVAIIIETVMQKRLTQALSSAGVSGWTILPVLGGSGRSGEWSREGQVGRGTGLVQVVCVVSPDKLDKLLESAFAVVEPQIGIVTVTDCEVLRAERF
ncbi:transcriptional regulator [Thalassococcus sp. CAU 1522]|uniref:Transcriptional regulator n=1 Tax=Thalassococcus arenae TaxID=2851652 RepID=A0ABS6N6P7_9RHOB|nr:transcriptional regulator [Thalassococcus arenae]MBV2359695.1 transcriptional regulator [Thalassococcus arenae]